MCLGHTHALSGVVAGTAVGLYMAHLPSTQLVLFAGLTAGAAVLPDIDHPNSTLAHCFGFLTRRFAWLIGKIAGGHRAGGLRESRLCVQPPRPEEPGQCHRDGSHRDGACCGRSR